MVAVWPVLAAFAAYAAGYLFYSRFLAKRIFGLDDARPTPAHALRDDVDYVPTKPLVLFGHHYASIAGLAPMLGPAVWLLVEAVLALRRDERTEGWEIALGTEDP